MYRILLSYVVILPSALLSYFPMKGQMKRAVGHTLAVIGPLGLLTVLAATVLTHWLGLRENDLLAPIFIVCFLAYHASLRVPLIKSLTTFSVMFALMSIFGNFAAYLSALGNANPGMSNFSVTASLCQIGLSLLANLLLARPFMKYGKLIIDQPSSSRVWYAVLLFSATIIAINLAILPIQYRLFDERQLMLPVMLVIYAQLVLWVLMLVILYSGISGALKMAEIEARNRILEMQESQYISQQRYIRASEKTRHDFMHSVHTLNELYDAGDYEAVGRYLRQYTQSMPAGAVTAYCANAAVNAMLNYYMHVAKLNGIDLALRVNLPDALPVSDVDMCSLIGNILENAVVACQKADEKVIRLTVLAEDGVQLYIVADNSFNGVVRQKDGWYLSTNRSGNGIGLASIASTAESCGGSAMFSHKGKRFYSNVAIPLK